MLVSQASSIREASKYLLNLMERVKVVQPLKVRPAEYSQKSKLEALKDEFRSNIHKEKER